MKLAEILWKKYAIPEEVARTICSTFLKSFRKCPAKPTVSLDEWRNYLWTEALIEPYTELADRIYLKWIELRYQYLALTPDIKSLLTTLHNHYFLGLITNGPSSAQWEKVQKLELQNYFDVILVSGDLPWEKPDREIFQEACKYLGVEPHKCAMVGDKLETDIQGGIEAELGCTVWIPLANQQANDKDPCPDYVISSITDLLQLLPCNTKIQNIRKFKNIHEKVLSLSDFEDCNSNASDGS